MQPYSRSHSRSHFNGHKKPPNFPTNGNNGGGYVSTSYDDVFGGPPKYATLAPRAEDYSEIFGAFRSSSATCNSRASSIPVLDLPDAADVGSGAAVEFDYSDVFEGFGDVGFAVSFDQLFRPFDARHCCSSSSDDDEAWTPVGAESLSDDSDPFALSEKSQSFLNENLDRPVDKQFSVSYNRVNLGTNTCISNMTHVAQLNAIPGFTCVVDETTSLRETGAKGCNPAEVDDIVFNVNSSSILPEKQKTKNIYAASSSHVTSAVESVSDINHIAKSSNSPPLSRPPPETAKGKGEIRSTSGLKTTDDCSSEVLGNNKLPPCFDMEVDVSSFATASTAAMNDAMKKAQAKLKATTLHSLPDKPIAQLRSFVAVNPAERKHEKKCSMSSNSVFIEGDGKLKEATPSNVDGKKISSSMKQFDDGHNSDSAEDVIVSEGNRPRLKTIKSVSRQAYYDKMSKVTLEAHDSAIGNSQGNHKEQKGKSGYESEKNARKIGLTLQVEKNSTSNGVKIKSKNDLGDEEVKKKEGKKKGIKAKEAYEEQKMENKLTDPVEQRKGKEERKVKEKRSKEPSPSETDFDGNQEFGQKKDMKRKTFVDVFGREKLERTCDFQENENKIDVLLRNEDGNFVEVAVRKQGSERVLEECVEQGEHRKYQGAPEKFIRPERQRRDEYHKLSFSSKESKEGPNRVNDGKKLEKSMKLGIEDNKAIRVDEMDEGSQNFVCGSPVIIEWHDDEIELPVEDEYMKSYGRNGVYGRSVEVQSDTPTAKFGSCRIAADEVWNVCAHRNGKVSAASCAKERNLKSVDTAYVLINEKLIESSAAEMGAFDGKGEKRVRTSDLYDGNESNNRSQDIMKHKNEKVAQSVLDPMLVKDYNIEKVNIKSTPAKAISGCNEREHAAMHLPDVSQSTEQKGKTSDKIRNFEEKTENKGNDIKEGQLRMLEEEKERQREREKDRNALEIARKRMMNEARERLEKVCADARERSFGDKASESRLKADRIAVERATAEAHRRAIEKVMVERETFEAQERMKRSISEKYLPERDVVKRQSSMPSMHSEEFEAGDLEPVQRCKARLERHRRTVERVAKALAEKNMRDLLALKEQAERSRLAETLGADIKRWSNGKEGNLRALLSTLQYILGPDSGWQPIPLTEVITATAVKKAYRKAALCVHPDKLQQRGASIQHKYVCEKVFDLLKEAWNRFNSEEK